MWRCNWIVTDCDNNRSRFLVIYSTTKMLMPKMHINIYICLLYDYCVLESEFTSHLLCFVFVFLVLNGNS